MLTIEQREILLKFSGQPHNFSLCRDELLHEIFEASADAFPNKNAVESPSASLTYRQLDEWANRLAHYLRAQGIGVEDKVAFQLPRTEFVYAAMLGILKAGAAYVPLDPSFPADRVSYILEDCGAKLFITAEEIYEPMRAELEKLATPLLFTTPQTDFDQPSGRLTRAETGQTPANLAYIIYTSGTTGRPKGCLLEHRNICSEVRSSSAVYGFVAADRVFQGFSVAFDASLEEIWMAFLNGCTLIVGTKQIIQSGPKFADILGDLGVTALSCVPTLLSMVEKDIPGLRILIFGGEACPKDLAARWHRPGRRIFNSYGPTEAAVMSTCAEVRPNAPVTIGLPIPNYRAYIMDEGLKPVPPGETGELCIGGPGVARGYLNREDLNQTRFIQVEALIPGQTERLYRTGDLARFTEEGEIDFLGRADDQVKLRGFRIELSEIESILLQCPGVLAASVTLVPELEQLAAYLVMRDGEEPNRKVIIQNLKERLPAYMTPSWLDVMDQLPTLVSGKVNRKLLPKPVNPLADEERSIKAPQNAREESLRNLWAELFNRQDGQNISTTDDFFLDLGGHSLLAARAASRLRVLPGYENISMSDLYQCPTIEGLAERFAEAATAPAQEEGLAEGSEKIPAAPAEDAEKTQKGMAEKVHSAFKQPSSGQHLLCSVLQALLLPFVAAIYAWVGLGAFFIFDVLIDEGWRILPAAVAGLGLYGLSIPLLLLVPLAAKWLLLGRVKAGRYPLWGFYYLRIWFVRQLLRAVPLYYAYGTPVISFFYRLMGAKIGKNVFMGNAGVIITADLLEIGDGSTIGNEGSVDGYWIEDGQMCLDAVTIGANCVVGNRCVVSPGSSMADNSSLGDLSLLDGRRRIPSLEFWSGSPARRTGEVKEQITPACWSKTNTPFLVLGAMLLPVLAEMPIFPGLFAAAYFDWYDTFHQYFMAVPLIAFTFIVIVCLQAVLIKKYLLLKVKKGWYPINSFFYVRHWFFSMVYAQCLQIVGTVFSTLYLRYWFRLMGVKLGKGSEVSTASNVQPDLLDIGDGCFVADDVMLGAPQVGHGIFSIAAVHIGDRTFLGNSAVVPSGTVIGSGSLLGCLSYPPAGGIGDNSSWFGSPAIFLPNRQKSACFDEALTFKPPLKLVAQRYAIEAVRVLLPNLLFVTMAIGVLGWLIDAWAEDPWLVIPMLPLSYLGMALFAFGILLGLKWLVIGRYKADNHPLWSNYVWRSELITGAYESFGARFLLDMLRGTPFISWALRLLGMKIGKRCYIDSTWFTEMDLISLGDDTALNEDANLQTHLFEDRVMKEGAIRIGNRCSIGAKAFILYDTELGDEVALEDLSIVMKGESLPGHSRWHGIPSRRQE